MTKAKKEKRIMAFGIDFLIASTIQGVLFASVIVYATLNEKQELIIPSNFICTGICFIYFLLKDVSGQSIGKKLIKLRIQNPDESKSPPKWKMIVRNVFITLWPVEMILLLSSNQRLGDRLTNTIVTEIEN